MLVDIACGWGRWSIAAARAEREAIGVDIHIDGLAASSRVARLLDAQAGFICCDAERLPFQSGTVDRVFSYDVLQHLDAVKVRLIFQ